MGIVVVVVVVAVYVRVNFGVVDFASFGFVAVVVIVAAVTVHVGQVICDGYVLLLWTADTEFTDQGVSQISINKAR